MGTHSAPTLNLEHVQAAGLLHSTEEAFEQGAPMGPEEEGEGRELAKEYVAQPLGIPEVKGVETTEAEAVVQVTDLRRRR